MADKTASSFSRLLTEAIYRIRHREAKNIQTIQDELGYALGKRGGASVEYWRKGHLPAKTADLEQLTRQLVRRGEYSADWAAQFLAGGGHPFPAAFLPQLFPETAVSPPPRRPQPTNLLSPPTPFFGRETELAAIGRRLKDPDCRLLTLVGPGGIGKTRLALTAAQQQAALFPDGLFFVALDAVAEPAQLLLQIVASLHLPLHKNAMPKTVLLHHLQAKKLLLILDNFEHLIGEAPLVAEILRHAPAVQLLITSRERLRLRGEWVFNVAGMAYPAGSPLRQDAAAGQTPAVQMFVQSAKRVRADFAVERVDIAAITEICRLVEGFPLAIELAASWVRLLTCAEIAAEIRRNYEFLATDLRDVPPRHRSLQSVFEYSWALLSPAEQALLCRLTVFQGAFRRRAGQEVVDASLPLLAALADKSLLQVGRKGAGMTAVTYYQMHELIRFFAQEKLSAAEERHADGRQFRRRLQERHAVYYGGLLEKYVPRAQWGMAAEIPRELGPERENVRAARDWLLRNG